MRLRIENKKNRVGQASLLIIISGLVSKILAAIYRIPYQNIVGDRGFYAYQQIYPILAIISTLSLTAFPNILSSLMNHSKKYNLKTILLIEIIVCYTVSLLLYVFRNPLAILLGTSQFSLSIILLSILLILTPFLSFYRGMAQSDENMIPTSVSQVLEQFVRIGVIILSAIGYSIFHWTIYQTANYAVSGNLIASFFTLIYLKKQSSYRFRDYISQGNFSFTDLKSISSSTLIFLFYSIYLLLFQFLDSLLVKSNLVLGGVGNIEAEVVNGFYDRGQPIIQFGLIFSTAIFMSFLPLLTRKYHSDLSSYQTITQELFEFIFYGNLVITFGLISILDKINIILFKESGKLISLGTYCCLVFLSSTVQFLHQKYFIEGKNRSSFIYLMVGLLLKLCLTPLFVIYFNILGASISSVIAFSCVLILYLKTSKLDLHFMYNLKFYFLLSILFFTVSGSLSLIHETNRLILLFILIGIVGISGSIFAYFCLKFSVFKKTLWQFIPFVK